MILKFSAPKSHGAHYLHTPHFSCIIAPLEFDNKA